MNHLGVGPEDGWIVGLGSRHLYWNKATVLLQNMKCFGTNPFVTGKMRIYKYSMVPSLMIRTK